MKGLEYMNDNPAAFYFLVMVARGYFFNWAKKPPNYEHENSPFEKTSLIKYVRSFFEPQFSKQLEDEDKNLEDIFVMGKSERSDAFAKARVHFVQDLWEVMTRGGPIW